MYKKPVLFQTEDLAEGVYAASGSSSGGVKFTPGSFKPYWAGDPNSGAIDYTMTLPMQYVGKRVIVTVDFDRVITNMFSNGWTQNVLGKSATLTIMSAPSTSTVTIQSNEGNPDIKSVSIQEA